MYQPRLYRGDMNRSRFRFFRSVHHESDLLIGVPHAVYRSDMPRIVERELIRIRKLILDYAERDPGFLSALEPVNFLESRSNTQIGSGKSSGIKTEEEVRMLIDCGQKAGTGPMAAIAGLFAQQVGQMLISSFGDMEVVVENGGDIFLSCREDLVSVIHAGTSVLSDKMAFVIPAGEWGICTSSGTLGHSFSQGKADAVTVISSSAPLADAWATALANRIQRASDIETTLDLVAGIPEIRACAVILDDRVGVRGEFELKLLTSEE